MRLLFTCLVLLGLLRPARAQMHKNLIFNGKGWPGTYVLAADRQQPHAGSLRVYAHELIVFTDQGQTLRYKPEEVYRVQVGRVRYTTAQGFKTKTGLWATRQSGRLFVEVLDSGRVSLLRYTHYVGGHDNTTTTALATYLLHAAAADSVVTLPVNSSGKGRRFQETLLPYFASRPDLRQLVEYGAITIDNLPALVRAYNSGQPFPYSSVEETRK
jgi:hypothetical protein